MKITVLTGAGISRESSLKTFRDEDGLWAGHRIEDVCTPDALRQDPQRVLNFYNLRRAEIRGAEPNAGHIALAALEKDHEVTIVTQNIDDLHERAGSSNIIHIHGEAFKVRSMDDFELVSEARGDVNLGDFASDGSQLRPHVCFFYETPYRWEDALNAALEAEIFVVVGTSLQVYPAAGLVDVTEARQVILVDPHPPRETMRKKPLHIIAEPASTGVAKIADLLAVLK